MATNTDYYGVHAGQKHHDEVEYMHGISAPLVVGLELSAATLTPGVETQALDFAAVLPAGALLISAWVEGEALSSSDANTTGANVTLGPSGGDADGWLEAVDLFTAGHRQGAAGALWPTLAPVLAAETTPAATITATGPDPDLAHLSGAATLNILYRRTVGEAPK